MLKSINCLRVFSILLILIASFSGCQEKIINKETALSESPSNEHLVMSVLWQQTSGEYRALAHQAFNIARKRLDDKLADSSVSKKDLAIVLDVDETVLDNSPYEGAVIKKGLKYPKGWQEWVNKGEALPIPGVYNFLKYADFRGVSIFYVTNRKEKSFGATLLNLRNLGFPQVESDRLLVKKEESGKERRRKKIAEEYEIFLLIGDNLSDFDQVFEQQSIDSRFNLVDSLRNEFGSKFIILPNAMYGDWVGAVYNYDWSMSDSEKNKARKSKITDFEIDSNL